MSNWKKWSQNVWWHEPTGRFLSLLSIREDDKFIVTIGDCEKTPTRNSYAIKYFPTEQAAREFIEEFVGVSANGKLSDSKPEDQGSSPCAPDALIQLLNVLVTTKVISLDDYDRILDLKEEDYGEQGDHD